MPILTVGPQRTNYFFVGAGAEKVDPGNPDSPEVFAGFESQYDDREPRVWAPAKNDFPFVLGMIDPYAEPTVPYTWAKAVPAGGSPAPDAPVGGNVTGLVGSGLVLQNNGTDDENVNGNGPFSFDTLLEPGSSYSVTVATDPTNPAQFCVVAGGTGTVPTEGVDDVLVTCADVPESPPPTPPAPDAGVLPGAILTPLLLSQ